MLRGPDIQITHTFTYVLVKLCKPDSLIPLFTHIDMCYRDGTKPEDLDIKIVKMLKTLLGYSQVEFEQSHAFSVISHLLSVCSSSHLTFKLYREFYSMLEDRKSVV